MTETIEIPQQADTGFTMWERQLGQTPAERLAALPHEGFTPEQHEQLIGQIVAVGLPVDNYTKLMRRPNDRGNENVLGSWGTGSDNYGEYSVYERLDREIPEKRLGTVSHESGHANTPLRPENARLFGGEDQRAKAEVYARNLAAQSLITGKYLTGYQKHLAKQLMGGEITLDHFTEETQAIATELALTNRAKLAQVEGAQHAKMASLRKDGRLSEDVPTVNLLSHTDATSGEVQADGIDEQLIALIDGVSDPKDLLEHTAKLKAQFYPDQSLAVAEARLENQETVVAVNERLRAMSSLALADLVEEDYPTTSP